MSNNNEQQRTVVKGLINQKKLVSLPSRSFSWCAGIFTVQRHVLVCDLDWCMISDSLGTVSSIPLHRRVNERNELVAGRNDSVAGRNDSVAEKNRLVDGRHGLSAHYVWSLESLSWLGGVVTIWLIGSLRLVIFCCDELLFNLSVALLDLVDSPSLEVVIEQEPALNSSEEDPAVVVSNNFSLKSKSFVQACMVCVSKQTTNCRLDQELEHERDCIAWRLIHNVNQQSNRCRCNN